MPISYWESIQRPTPAIGRCDKGGGRWRLPYPEDAARHGLVMAQEGIGCASRFFPFRFLPQSVVGSSQGSLRIDVFDQGLGMTLRNRAAAGRRPKAGCGSQEKDALRL